MINDLERMHFRSNFNASWRRGRTDIQKHSQTHMVNKIKVNVVLYKKVPKISFQTIIKYILYILK